MAKRAASPGKDRAISDHLTDSAERLFTAHCTPAVLQAADAGTWPAALWEAVEQAGFCAAMLPEAAGGFGATMPEAMALLRVAAAHAAPIPLAETMLAAWLLAQAGLPVPSGPLTLAPVRRHDKLTAERADAGWRLAGTVHRVPWARHAGLVVLALGPDGPVVAALPQGAGTITPGANLANEPRDTVTLDAYVPHAAAASANCTLLTLRAAGAALRTNQIAGALSQALGITTEYVQTRVQFGRQIGKFQAVQQNMAVFAGQSAAALAAADMAADALAMELNPVVIGAAKARAGEAASVAAGLAHQAHGAIGFTQEYRLHSLTRRLWSWRDEFGNETEWYAVVGRAAFAAGADHLWPTMTAA